MLTFTTNQLAILILVLVLGWLLGLLSRSGGAKWRRAYRDEQALREAAEARATSAEARLAEVERTVTARPVAATPTANARDDLALIRGIGLSGQARLNDLGFTTYRQLIELNARDEADLEARLGAEPGTIEHEQWREQARLLANEALDEHRQRYRL